MVCLLLAACGKGSENAAPDAGRPDGGEVLLDCWDRSDAGLVAVFANPNDFSLNSETGARDRHSFIIAAEDVFARKTVYTTIGTADHQHQVQFTVDEIKGIQGRFDLPGARESGPPLNAPAGHTHVIQLHNCGLPGD